MSHDPKRTAHDALLERARREDAEHWEPPLFDHPDDCGDDLTPADCAVLLPRLQAIADEWAQDSDDDPLRHQHIEDARQLAVNSLSSRVRPAASRGRRHNRAAGRPPSSIAIDRSHLVSPVLERRCRSDRPGTCSTNVLREQLFRSQKYRRTRSRTITLRDANGLSSRVR